MEIYEWQDCTPNEIDFFETCFLDGDKKIKLQGVSLRLRQAYDDYYAYRSKLDGEKNTRPDTKTNS